MEEREILQERLELALLRIREIPGEDFQGAELLPWKEYFTTVAKFLLLIEDTRQFLEQGKQATATLEELQQRNRALYEDILPENYENSFANPAYAVKMLGEEFGVLASFLYTEMRSLIGFTYEAAKFDTKNDIHKQSRYGKSTEAKTAFPCQIRTI